MKILVKFPTRGRKDLFFKTFNKFHELSITDKVSYLVSIDLDDSIMNETHTLDLISSYPNTTVVCGYSKNKADAVNRDVNTYKEEWDIVIVAADDTVPCILGWDRRIIDEMERHYPDTDGVLFFNDGFWGDQLNTQCILGHKFYDRFGWIVYPGYTSLWFDNDFQSVASILGKQTYFSDVIIKHEHPSFGFGILDEIHKKNEEYDNIDKQVYEDRKFRLFDIPTKKIKIVHLLLTPLDGLYESKQKMSMACFNEVKSYVHSYTQQFNWPNKTLLPIDTCADPGFITEKPVNEGPCLSYGHYGAYLAHKRAILEEFSEDLDALVIVEGDAVFNISPAEMAFQFHKACEFAEKHNGSLVTFGNVGFGTGSEASMKDTTIPMGDYTKIDHFISAHCYMIMKNERLQIQHKLKTEKWHAWDIWLYWNYDKKVPIFRTKTPLIYEPKGFSTIDQKIKEINVIL